MNIKNLRDKSAAELSDHLLDLRKEQFALRMQKATGQLAQSHQIKRVRREIAQATMLLADKK
ncbi:MAG: 50S ribosomal protein L29 [Xanthomonadaceae bacterium]|jgi:large subunit ribosomal protein L29|nr:50S ribosomal protein L29 [Xanthomonadaceae bacterium]MDP2184759.1 50S ribosomal protein L29 [Xanthomonadales bacterium]PIQ37469.1 MAG: 50S ribosomal protein L29 [Xanthomonadales bacterium CG17_big_fil_post_rev_8_21_14_2_50_64_11]PIX61599.1 MAG: 50S ribosomal protein L29 [Xanthomonadales bacterium CG_4_10_14_3_um_filter_64_11]PKM01285.1 MAG: 50S ribosomal protein L29 [Gammaproteobacteria bacterium HGW-Gammaproteobacteria-6]PKM15135.1 MAG: 50S ribosomal protein L29 [Gammaproteobacteria bacte